MAVDIGFLQPISTSQTRRPETKETLFHTRKRVLKYLVLNFLLDEGCSRTAEVFVAEGNINSDYKLCDNIDLDILLQEYDSYYTLKYNKRPHILKKVDEAEQVVQAASLKKKIRKKKTQVKNIEPEKEVTKEKILDINITQLMPMDNDHGAVLYGKDLSLKTVERNPDTRLGIENTDSQSNRGDYTIYKKSLNDYLSLMPTKNKEMVELVYQDIVSSSVNVTWADIFGLEEAKSLLMESVIYPLKFPNLFTGLLSPWKGILLHGPPGTGKTMLARAVANQSNCTFFNVSTSTIVSKWRGDSEKIIKILFDMAQFYAPSIVFVDELECIASQRDRAGEHEASRRLKSQLLVELDGVEKNQNVFLMATSNLPWEIDPAMLRRLEKRIYTPLPDSATRAAMFQSYLCVGNISCAPTLDYNGLANMTEGYSGCDIRLVCKEAAMVSVRRLISSHGCRLAKNKTNPRPPTQDEVERAIHKTKPVAKHLADKHIQWQNKMGSQ